MYQTLTPLFPGGVPGGTELVVILLIAVLLFGANKIPKIARSTGQAIGEFRKGREQVEQELQELQEGVSLDEEGNVIEDGSTDGAEDDTVGEQTGSTDDDTATSTESTESTESTDSSESGASTESSETDSSTNQSTETTGD